MSSIIPEEICFEILLKLPTVKSLLACKCVCKTWRSLISSPGFVKRHLHLASQRNKPNLMLKGLDYTRIKNHSRIYTIGHDSLKLLMSTDRFLDYAKRVDYPFKSSGYSVKLMGCCDGLVSLWLEDIGREFFCLWNPATTEYRELPTSNIHYVSMVAFGYDYKSNDYKLLAGDYYDNTFEVYSLRSNSWRIIEDVEYEFDCRKPSGVLVNGYFHWLVTQRQQEFSDDVVLVSLDINTEMFKEIELPIKQPVEGFQSHNLGVVEGSLCLILVNLDSIAEVWVMQTYGVEKSWTKRYTIDEEIIRISQNLRLVWSFKSGEILFGAGGVVSGGLFTYHPEDGFVTKPNISAYPHLCQEGCYFESLVSLGTGTYTIKRRSK